MRQRIWAIMLVVPALASCHDKRRVSRENFTRAVVAYLEKRGDLCLAKPDWPVDVSEREARAGSRNAVQMPVLERLGLVRSSDAVAEVRSEDEVSTVKVKRYELTESGKAYYIARGGEGAAAGARDFCAAKLSLDQVVGWEMPKGELAPQQTVVHYTYKVDAAPWTRDPEAERVFPAVARVVRGAGSDQLTEGLTLTAEGWIANDLLPEGSMAPRPAASETAARHP